MFANRSYCIIKSFIRRQHFYIDNFDLSATGIPRHEFHQRRQSLVNLIRNYIKTEQKQSCKDFTICLPSSSRLFMGPDVAYFPFKQQSDFYYLTGCMQPDAVLLLNGNDETFSTNLFLSRNTTHSIEEYERWFGPTISDREKICEIFGIDEVYPIDQLLTFRFPPSSTLFYNAQFINDKTINKQNLVPFLKRFSSSIVCSQLTSFLHTLRSIKSLTEQNLIRQACELVSKAFVNTMKNCKKDTQNEYFIKARFQYECEILDDVSMAFYPVVAASGRSNVIHYQKNNQNINKDDLIMLDGGCLFKQYASDVTRLWPINGRFSSVQRQLYEILLAVQKHLINYLNLGDNLVTREKLNSLADHYMTKYLREESIFPRAIDDYHAKNLIHVLCPTGVSHHLGLDVHDCDLYSSSEKLQPGNIITIEPGLYIPFNCKDVPPMYRGFASRIEDDVLLTKQGFEVLSSMCPKEIDDLHRILDDRDKSNMH
ncbi:unnamed protein product [Rotaria socialis]|uniref:Aminopeptidase P N-terminal domain-containing protein n=1 Tax=Rotaria socialis TaxID=392032 RepID=A0A820Y452_9BILA|nr:unnamed protein product [Rotaria socialis]CAF4544164.1 unnamed protein product [Rotaria socialis]